MRLNFAQLTLEGYWFCHFCNRVTTRVQHGVKFVCSKCERHNNLEYIKGIE